MSEAERKNMPEKPTNKDGVGDRTPDSSGVTSRQEIEQIKAENLTGQQLRMARKLAHHHELEATSDLDAVRLLRKNGIDPFKVRQNVIANSNQEIERGEGKKANLPAKRTKSDIGAPGGQSVSDAQRARAIMKIQRDLARRRRRRIAQLCARISFFVALPTIITGYYFFSVATPMYSVKSEFAIQSAENPVAPSVPSLFGGGGSSIFAAGESVGVQGYLTSIEAMSSLSEEYGFKEVFQSDKIDPIQRMDADATNEKAFKTYKKKVLVGFDPTEGIIRMEVIAPDPDKAIEFSNALIDYAEKRVDDQTDRLRGDQKQAARELYEEAERNLRVAQEKVLTLQEKRGVLNTELEVTSQMQQVATLETTLLNRKLSLAELNNNVRPNEAKVNALTNQIIELEKSIAELRDGMTAGSESSSSLARVTSELDQAKSEVLLRQNLLAQSVTTLEAASIEASRQTKYLALNVNPVKPDEAAYPRKFENTFLAFLVFAGLYLMLSLTGSILREQVSN